MNSQQKQENLFEIRVPIFCEWTFEKNLKLSEDSSIYNYTAGIVGANKRDEYLTTPEYSLPGFPGIKYYLSVYMEQSLEETLDLEFNFHMDYQKYDFDADFSCTITECEPKHFVRHFNNATDEDCIISFALCNCFADECAGCPVCADQKIVIQIEGTFIVKNVDTLWNSDYKISDETRKLSYEDIDTKDFVIVVEEQEIRVHKSVLAENSTVFARMLDSDKWKETIESKYVIPNLPYKIVKYAIDVFYDCMYPNWKKEEFLILFKFADKYHMEKLTKYIKETIVFTPHNVVEYANYFLQNDVIELVNCCIDYIFTCSQYSIPIKDIELLDFQIRAMCFDRMFVSSVLKKDPKLEHRSFNYENDGIPINEEQK